MPDNRLNDQWWRLNNLYWIIDANGQRVKFKLNGVQTELYNTLWYLNEILKSRQHGVTTFFCILFLDVCLFDSNVRAGIIAHNREDAESFFQDKVKYAYDNLDFSLPGLKGLRDATSSSARELLLSNNSAIRVGTSLRSATLQYLHISEYGKICAKYPEKAKEIRTGALNTVHIGQFITIESTAEGREGHFYEMDKIARDLQRSGKKLTKMDFKHFFFAWWKKPDYRLDADDVVIPPEFADYFTELRDKHGIDIDGQQKAWYVKKYETQQDEMKREFPSTPDEAFEAAVVGAYYSRQMAKAREEGRITEVPYDPNSLVHTAWDLGINDDMAIWFFQVLGPWVNIIDYYTNHSEGMEHYKRVMDDKGYLYGTPFAPHDIKKRDLISGKNRIQRAKEQLGLAFEEIDRAADVLEDINEVRRLFYRFRFDETKCDAKKQENSGLKAVEGYRKEWDEKNGCFKLRPLHNWASNGADALRTLTHGILNLDGIGIGPTEVQPEMIHHIGL